MVIKISLVRSLGRAVALVAAMALVAGCGSTVETRAQRAGDEFSTAAGASSSAGASAADAPSAVAPTRAADAIGPAVSKPDSPAARNAANRPAATSSVVSDKPIKLGYTVADVAGIAAALGVAGYNASEQTQATRDEWKALIAYANAHGGVGGRKIVGNEYVVTGTTNTNALCVQATEDDHDDAVLDFDSFSTDADVACFAKHQTPLVAQLFGQSREAMLQTRPYVATTFALPDRAEPGLIDGLNRVDYFNNAKVGVIMDDLPLIKKIWSDKMQPALNRLGVKVVATHYFNPTDPGAQASQAQTAVLDFKSKGVDHVIAAVNVLVLITYTQAEQNAAYYARLGLGDYFIGASAAPGNAQYFPGLARGMKDAVAVSVSGVIIDDPSKKQGAVIDRNNPSLYPGTRRCLDVLSEQLKTDYYRLDNNARARGWNAICDSFFLWWQDAQKVGAAYTRQNWGTVIPQFGTGFQSAVVHGTLFSPTQYDGGADYRIGKYYGADTACTCYQAILKDYFPLPTS